MGKIAHLDGHVKKADDAGDGLGNCVIQVLLQVLIALENRSQVLLGRALPEKDLTAAKAQACIEAVLTPSCCRVGMRSQIASVCRMLSDSSSLHDCRTGGAACLHHGIVHTCQEHVACGRAEAASLGCDIHRHLVLQRVLQGCHRQPQGS